MVDYLQGRTDSMIFILNRVDMRGSDDLPLEERLDKLRVEIQQELSLSELPDIIPFNARLLYYAQCAWGTNPLNAESNVSQELRVKLINHLLDDCATIIKNKVKQDKTLKHWFRDLEDDLEEEKIIDDEKMRQLLKYALEWSGGEALWQCIRFRLKESFPELVILPALRDVFDAYESFSSSLNSLIQTKKITDLEEVQKKQDELVKFRENFPGKVKKISEEFQKEIGQYVEDFKSKDQTKISKTIEQAQEKGYKGFQIIFETVQDVEGDLIECLIAPVRDALKNPEGIYDLEDKLKEVIPPSYARDVARQYDNVSRRISYFSPQGRYLIKKVRIDNNKEIQKLEHD